MAHAAASEERRKSVRNGGWDAPSESSPNDPGPSASCHAKQPIQVPSAGGAIRCRRVMIGLHVHSPMSHGGMAAWNSRLDTSNARSERATDT